MVWEKKKKKKIKYKFHSDLHWITSSCPCLYWAIWSFIRIHRIPVEKEATVAGTSLSRGLQADPSKWKGSMLWWQVPQAALSDSFISGVLRWGLKRGGRGRAGDTLFLKVSESTPRFTDQGRRYKSKQKRVSARPSPNLLLTSRAYSLHTRFHLRLESSYSRLFITDGRNKKRGRKESSVRRLQPKGTTPYLDIFTEGIMIYVGHSPNHCCSGNLIRPWTEV